MTINRLVTCIPSFVTAQPSMKCSREVSRSQSSLRQLDSVASFRSCCYKSAVRSRRLGQSEYGIPSKSQIWGREQMTNRCVIFSINHLGQCPLTFPQLGGWSPPLLGWSATFPSSNTSAVGGVIVTSSARPGPIILARLMEGHIPGSGISG